jgi:hypothetical protein
MLARMRQLTTLAQILAVVSLGCGALLLSGCEEEKPKAAPAPEPAPPPEPKKIERAPTLLVDSAGPMVRGMSALLRQDGGEENTLGLGKLKEYLAEEEKFLTDKDVLVTVDRQANPQDVAVFLREIGTFKPKSLKIQTKTRDDFPGAIEFLPESSLSAPDPCTLIGTITDDRGTAIWRLSGGTARKRGRGMGGPDLSMTADTIQSMSKTCGSDLFFVTAVEGVEWGLLFDLAASAISLDGAGLKRAVTLTDEQTAGHAVKLPQ